MVRLAKRCNFWRAKAEADAGRCFRAEQHNALAAQTKPEKFNSPILRRIPLALGRATPAPGKYHRAERSETLATRNRKKRGITKRIC